MEVLLATESDAEDILKLQYAAYRSEAELHDDFNISPLTQSLEELKADFKTKTVLKIVENGKLLASGQARLESGCCHIGRMAVWLFGCLAVWLFGCLAVWLFGCLATISRSGYRFKITSSARKRFSKCHTSRTFYR